MKIGNADHETTQGQPTRGRALLGALSLLGALTAGCFPRVAPAPGALSASSVTWGATRWPGETASGLAHGRELFVASCNRCHGYPDLTAISDERWPHLVEWMGKKSHLDAAGRDAVLHYVLAYRADR